LQGQSSWRELAARVGRHTPGAQHRRLRLFPQRALPRQGPAREAICPRLLAEAKGRGAGTDGHTYPEGLENGGQYLDHGDTHASWVVVDPGFRTSRGDRGETRLGGDVCDS